jgi:hypothetical protein
MFRPLLKISGGSVGDYALSLPSSRARAADLTSQSYDELQHVLVPRFQPTKAFDGFEHAGDSGLGLRGRNRNERCRY